MQRFLTITLILCIIHVGAVSLSARPRYQNYQDAVAKVNDNIIEVPYPTIAVHNVGLMAMTVSNFGVLGLGVKRTTLIRPPVNGLPLCNSPKVILIITFMKPSYGSVPWSDEIHLFRPPIKGGWWSSHEFWPREYPEGDISFRSITETEDSLFDSALSHQDFIAYYYDTLTDISLVGFNYFTGEFHRPLNIEVKQSSYAWAYDYAEDFVILDFEITNMELRTLEDAYIGFYVDNDIGKTNNNYYGFDDVVGFLEVRRSPYIAGLNDTLELFWASDNDGDPDPYSGGYAGYAAPTSVAATKVLRSPVDNINYTFNWWHQSYDPDNDWGPRKVGPDGVRSFYGGGLGTPITDGDMYYMMANGEFDYDQSQAYYDKSSEGWMEPPDIAYNIAFGGEIKYLLSFGPYDLEPGDPAHLTLAMVMGRDFYWSGQIGQPTRIRDFTDLHLNALWAEWIYDNPGVDTDGDNYYGKYHIFCMNPKIDRIDTIVVGPADTIFDTTITCTFNDTLYYSGDGVPDFRGAEPPEPPEITLYPRIDEYNQGEITIRWNGYTSENSQDQFSQRIDFEGYRVYISRSGQIKDFTLVTSYDIENYDRWEYDRNLQTWVVRNPPYDMRLLHNMYGDNFDPAPYTDVENLFPFYNRSTGQWESYYFTRHDWNQSDYTDSMMIHKLYPNQDYPSTLNLDSARMFYPDEVTENGDLKYYEYRYVLRNLIPSIPYYVAVTTFDAGFPGTNLQPQESRPADIAVRAYAQNTSQLVVDQGLDVIVYPNPYRIDGNYRRYFEGWEDPLSIAERQRVLHFTNLPPRCTIRIYTIDGDLVSTVEHSCDIDDPDCTHETWDLISRNDMSITSGIYYYHVESDYGNQIGKFVVIY